MKPNPEAEGRGWGQYGGLGAEALIRQLGEKECIPQCSVPDKD